MLGPSSEHFNISEHGVRVLDRTVGNGTSRIRIIDVYFKPEKVLCEYCDSNSCRYVQFASGILDYNSKRSIDSMSASWVSDYLFNFS